MQPKRSARKEGDNVTAFPYSRLATSLRSLAIILLYIYTYYHSHPRLQPYSTNYHTYAYEAERWRTCPYRWQYGAGAELKAQVRGAAATGLYVSIFYLSFVSRDEG